MKWSVKLISVHINRICTMTQPYKYHKSNLHTKSETICYDYNTSFGCTRNQYCHYKHQYIGTVVATCQPITVNINDTSLVKTFKIQRIGTYTLRHNIHTPQQNSISYYNQHISFTGTAMSLQIPKLHTVIQEQDQYITETTPSLLPVIMTLKYNNQSLSQYNFVTYRNSLNYIINDDDTYRIHIQRVGNTVFLKPCSSIGARVYVKHNRGVAGYLFESVCSNESMTDQYTEYCHVEQVQIGNFKCAVAAEIDGSMNEPLHNNSDITLLTQHDQHSTTPSDINIPYYIELKTVSGQPWSKQRLGKVLTQSYLVGTPYILVANLKRMGNDTPSLITKQPLRTLSIDSLQYIDVQYEMTELEQSKRLQQAEYILQFITQNTVSDKTYRLHRINNNGTITYELAELDSKRYSYIQQQELIDVQRWRDKVLAQQQ